MTPLPPPRWYLRPRLELLPRLAVCWLRGHRWVLTSFGPDGWGTYAYDCVRCDARCRW